jgi:hypothetical protein
MPEYALIFIFKIVISKQFWAFPIFVFNLLSNLFVDIFAFALLFLRISFIAKVKRSQTLLNAFFLSNFVIFEQFFLLRVCIHFLLAHLLLLSQKIILCFF